jgi:hypothetical protein
MLLLGIRGWLRLLFKRFPLKGGTFKEAVKGSPIFAFSREIYP